jgi:hypothetical protein
MPLFMRLAWHDAGTFQNQVMNVVFAYIRIYIRTYINHASVSNGDVHIYAQHPRTHMDTNTCRTTKARRPTAVQTPPFGSKTS